MRKHLAGDFFSRPTLRVARELLGKFLVRRVGRLEMARMITEVEAYVGSEDRASHASRGMTERNRVMFGPAGRWYVYFTYGMHWMLNIVTEREAYPAAVLIRGVQGATGPARVTKLFGIDGHFNAKPASRTTGLWIEDRGARVAPRAMRSAPRVGVEYAGKKWKEKLWRYYLWPSIG